VLTYSDINTSGNWENEKLYGNTTPEGRSVFIQFRVFPTSTSVDITIYQYGKNVLYFFYNIAMSKARRIRKISVFTSGGKFPVLTLSYINTALSQSALRIYKCYIIKEFNKCWCLVMVNFRLLFGARLRTSFRTSQIGCQVQKFIMKFTNRFVLCKPCI
jgi:hypothetical protein